MLGVAIARVYVRAQFSPVVCSTLTHFAGMSMEPQIPETGDKVGWIARGVLTVQPTSVSKMLSKDCGSGAGGDTGKAPNLPRRAYAGHDHQRKARQGIVATEESGVRTLNLSSSRPIIASYHRATCRLASYVIPHFSRA